MFTISKQLKDFFCFTVISWLLFKNMYYFYVHYEESSSWHNVFSFKELAVKSCAWRGRTVVCVNVFILAVHNYHQLKFYFCLLRELLFRVLQHNAVLRCSKRFYTNDKTKAFLENTSEETFLSISWPSEVLKCLFNRQQCITWNYLPSFACFKDYCILFH